MKIVVETHAPSNIALIKYMGKTNVASNSPSNASISYALNNFITTVQVEGQILPTPDLQLEWRPLNENIQLSEKGRLRFLKHFEWLCREFGLHGKLTIRSGNNFPSDCGLASSASSFAALTKAFAECVALATGRELSIQDISKLSQRGSGSSCRSFFQWAIWKDNGAEPAPAGLPDLLHDAVILEESKKLVSSSEAHVRVTTSENFEGRVERAESRLQNLLAALSQNQWSLCYEICWAEFWDMHSLFETSQPHFSYMTEPSLNILRRCESFWNKNGDGPLVTMDAGPNVHLLWRTDQAELRDMLKSENKSFRWL